MTAALTFCRSDTRTLTTVGSTRTPEPRYTKSPSVAPAVTALRQNAMLSPT
jgi:hypothetical protein